ncbi:hypothetical protein CR513_48249, partial [Mucuna pruriens]
MLMEPLPSTNKVFFVVLQQEEELIVRESKSFLNSVNDGNDMDKENIQNSAPSTQLINVISNMASYQDTKPNIITLSIIWSLMKRKTHKQLRRSTNM